MQKMRPHERILSNGEKKDKRQVIHDIGRKLIGGENGDIVQRSLNIYPWLTRHMIHECAQRMKANLKIMAHQLYPLEKVYYLDRIIKL